MKPGLKEVSFYVSEALHDQIKQIAETRGRTLNHKINVCWIEQEAFEHYVKSIDPQTGLLRQAPMPTSWGLCFPSVCGRLDWKHCSEDADLFQALDEYTMLMTWVCGLDLENQHASHALRDYVGCPQERFLKKGWADLLHPDDRAWTYSHCIECFGDRQPFQLLYRIRRKDGRYGFIVDTVEPRLQSDGRVVGFIGTMYEVGARSYHESVRGAMPRGRRAAKRHGHDVDVLIFQTKHHSRE